MFYKQSHYSLPPRLVSAYENKILYSDFQQLPYLLGSRNFSTFVDFVLKDADAAGCFIPQCDVDGGRPTTGTCDLDLHWRPFYARCGFCDVTYDFVGRAESFSEDMVHVLEATGLMEAEEREKLNAVPHTENRTAEYFAQLDAGQRQRLWRLYQVDFEMFGYNADWFMAGCGDSATGNDDLNSW